MPLTYSLMILSVFVLWAVLYFMRDEFGYLSVKLIISAILLTIFLTIVVPLGIMVILAAIVSYAQDADSIVNRKIFKKKLP